MRLRAAAARWLILLVLIGGWFTLTPLNGRAHAVAPVAGDIRPGHCVEVSHGFDMSAIVTAPSPVLAGGPDGLVRHQRLAQVLEAKIGRIL